MKKAFLSLAIILSFILGCHFVPINATAKSDFPISYYEYYDNGYYAEIAVNINYVDAVNSIISGYKTYYYYDSSNQILWSYTLYGTFSYNGSTATCTNTDDSYNINNSNWHNDSHGHYGSGNTAYGSVTMKKKVLGITVDTVTKNVSLSCSPDGTLY